MNSFKFSLLTLTVIILIFTIQTTAQQPDSTQQNVSPLQAGSWSIQFGYNNNLGFTSFKGGNISAKYHFTDNSALRFGVNINIENEKDNKNNLTQFNTGINFEELKRDIIDIGILTNYVYYFRAKNNVNPFISSGINFGISYSKSDSKNSFNHPDSIDNIASSKVNGWFAGVDFSVGVEWFVAENFSIHGEYETIFKYSYYKNKYTTTDFRRGPGVTSGESTVKDFTVSPSNVLIGISLYF